MRWIKLKALKKQLLIRWVNNNTDLLYAGTLGTFAGIGITSELEALLRPNPVNVVQEWAQDNIVEPVSNAAEHLQNMM